MSPAQRWQEVSDWSTPYTNDASGARRDDDFGLDDDTDERGSTEVTEGSCPPAFGVTAPVATPVTGIAAAAARLRASWTSPAVVAVGLLVAGVVLWSLSGVMGKSGQSVTLPDRVVKQTESVAVGGPPSPVAAAAAPPSQMPTPTATSTAEEVTVHVAGHVVKPGVVTVRAGARLTDVVNAAGGFTDDADPAGINLARVVADAEQVYVPAVGEQGRHRAASANPEPSAHATTHSGPVNVNTATAAQLEKLPGVGPVLAERIVTERETGGLYSSVADLQRVSGIGPASIDRLRGQVTT